MLANIVWLRVNNCFKGVVVCLYQEGDITTIMTVPKLVGLVLGGLISGRAYNRDFTVCCTMAGYSLQREPITANYGLVT